MNKRVPLLTFAVLAAAIPASADVLYSNGAVNGTVTAYGISPLFAVTDSFTLTSASVLTGVGGIGLWTDAVGDTPLSAQWGISSLPEFTNGIGGGGAPVATLTNTFLFDSGPFSIYRSSFPLPNITLPAGVYYLSLQNATTAQSLELFWDESSGPSLAFQTFVGQIPSESFQILGTPVPEPNTEAPLLVLFLCVVWLVRPPCFKGA